MLKNQWDFLEYHRTPGRPANSANTSKQKRTYQQNFVNPISNTSPNYFNNNTFVVENEVYEPISNLPSNRTYSHNYSTSTSQQILPSLISHSNFQQYQPTDSINFTSTLNENTQFIPQFSMV